jgi:hypothetical protein
MGAKYWIQAEKDGANVTVEIIGSAPLLAGERTPAGFLRSVFRATPPLTQYEDIAATCAMLARKICH